MIDATRARRWDAYWTRIDSEELLAARALVELSPTVVADVCRWLRDVSDPLFDDDGEEVGEESIVDLDWQGWASALEERPFSTTETQLAHLVAALTTRRPIDLVATVGYTGSWETDIWRILTTWGTGGNNRDLPGRATVIPL